MKRHPFFKNVNWDDFINKRVRPPIIPDPELRKTCSKEFNSVDLSIRNFNPYILLDENFSSDVYDKDLEVFSSRDEINISLK